MMHRVQSFQPLPGYMRINLRRRNIRMTQQQLHHAQIRAVIQQVRGKSVKSLTKTSPPKRQIVLPMLWLDEH